MNFLKPAAVLLMITGLIVGFLSIAPELRAGEQTPQEQARAGEAAPQPEKIIAAPRDIKEGTAVYVFLGWTWLLIFVLIYILRQKVQESDRLYRAKFFKIQARRGSGRPQ